MAENYVIKMYSAAAGDSVVQVDVPNDGEIVGVHGTVAGLGLDADGDFVRAELSFLSTSQLVTNDARGSIFALEIMVTAATVASVTKTSESVFVNLPDGIPVAAGERLHMHVADAAGVSPSTTFMIYFATRKAPTRRSRRRR